MTILQIMIIALYLLPAFIAIARGHRNAAAITLTNILLGWTVIGYVVALIWSFTN